MPEITLKPGDRVEVIRYPETGGCALSVGTATVTESGDETLGLSADFLIQKHDVFRLLPEPGTAPAPLQTPNWQPVIDCVTNGTAQSIKDGYEDDDFKHYVYEAAMKAVYGDEYFVWQNKQRW